MPDKSKFEREIDEILEKTEDQEKQRASGSRSTGRRRSFEPFSPRVPRRKPPRRSTSIKINPGNVIVAGVILFAVAAFSPVAKIPIAIVGLLLIVGGYALWFRKGFPTGYGSGTSGNLFRRGKSTTKATDSEPQVKYWRGRRIEEKPASPERGKIIEFGSPDDTGDEK